jgi:hypothetical protein
MTILGVILAVIFPSYVFAAHISGHVDFEIPPQYLQEPVVIQGLRFSVNCWGIIKSRPGHSSYLNIDNSNNCESAPGDVYIDRQGAPFDFHGLMGVALEPNLEGFHVRSSRGDEVVSPWSELTVNWPDVQWLLLTNMGDSLHQGHGYDDIRYSYTVYEPATLWLIGIAGLMLFGFSRRMRWQ